MTTVVIIHGTGGSPEENWFPWLKDQVAGLGHKAITPTLPTPTGQNLRNWRASFKKQVGKVTKDTILVGHSLGAGFALDLIQHAHQPIRACFLVSAFTGELGLPEFDDLNRSFVCQRFDWTSIRRNAGKIYIYHGDNDPYVPLEKCLALGRELKTNPKIIPNGGHLNTRAGYTKFPDLWRDLEPIL